MKAVRQWLITGGAGFIGKRLTQKLLDQKQKVRIIDNFSNFTEADYARFFDYKKLSKDQVGREIQALEVIEGDIQDADLAKHVCQGIDVIVHLAANTGVQPSIQSPRMDLMNNCIGTFNYLEAARTHQVKRFVYASSGAVLGAVEPPLHEELKTAPLSPYGASKLAGEAYCMAFYHSFAVETVMLRFSNVYGPLSMHKQSVVAKFIRKILEDESLEIYGDGQQSRDFIFIDDIVSALLAAATQENVGGEVFQIATNVETSVNQMCALLFSVLEKRGIKVPKVTNVAPLVGDTRRNFADISKAKALLGWNNKTSLQEGLLQTVDWMIRAKEDLASNA